MTMIGFHRYLYTLVEYFTLTRQLPPGTDVIVRNSEHHSYFQVKLDFMSVQLPVCCFLPSGSNLSPSCSCVFTVVVQHTTRREVIKGTP